MVFAGNYLKNLASEKIRGLFAKKIKELREVIPLPKKGIRGVSESSMQKIENQNYVPRRETISKLAQALNYNNPAQLEELYRLANQQKTHSATIAPPASVQPAQQTIPKKHKQSGIIKVYLSLFSPELEPLELRLESLSDVNDLTHKVYHAIASPSIQKYQYGKTWVLIDRKSGKVIKNRRMLENLGWGQPQTDPRPLSDVGITAGSELEAIPTPCTT
jgi:DNA-binding XRE family transcriptional regulator